MILLLIVACELGFWLAVLLGLLFRYPLKMPRLGLACFLATPLIDLMLLILTVLDLRRGSEPSFLHGLAAYYIAFSLLFGRQLIAWADRMWRRKVRGEHVPAPARDAASRVRREWRDFGKAVVAAVIAVVILEVCAVMFDSAPESSLTLRGGYGTLGLVLMVWLFTGPVWEHLRGNREPGQADRVPAVR